jgi:hypothetical protein
MVDSTILIHRISRIIAATRFPFVDPETWDEDYQTIVNDDVNRFGIYWHGGITYPSIVILRGDGGVHELGMVEFAENVGEESVAKWQMLSDTASVGRVHKKFFIYVPHGYEEAVLLLLEENDVDYDGIRGYNIVNGSLKIYPYKTRNDAYDHR